MTWQIRGHVRHDLANTWPHWTVLQNLTRLFGATAPQALQNFVEAGLIDTACDSVLFCVGIFIV
jgi:hypothetical protein